MSASDDKKKKGKAAPGKPAEPPIDEAAGDAGPAGPPPLAPAVSVGDAAPTAGPAKTDAPNGTTGTASTGPGAPRASADEAPPAPATPGTPGPTAPEPTAPEHAPERARTPDPAPKAEPAGRKRAAAKKSKKKKKKKKAPGGRGVLAWFVAGFAFALAVAFGAAFWNAWRDPHLVIAPRIDALFHDFGGYLLAGCLFALALTAACVLRRRWAWLAPAALAIVGGVVLAGYTILLGIGAGLMCGREPVFHAASADRRLLVVAVRGNCGVTTEYTYRVSVREIGPSLPRETTIFSSFGTPVPAEAIFSSNRAITVIAKGKNGQPGDRYTVTIDRRAMKPDKVWRFSGGKETGRR